MRKGEEGREKWRCNPHPFGIASIDQFQAAPTQCKQEVGGATSKRICEQICSWKQSRRAPSYGVGVVIVGVGHVGSGVGHGVAYQHGLHEGGSKQGTLDTDIQVLPIDIPGTTLQCHRMAKYMELP